MSGSIQIIQIPNRIYPIFSKLIEKTEEHKEKNHPGNNKGKFPRTDGEAHQFQKKKMVKIQPYHRTSS